MNDAVQKVAKNEAFIAVARFCMILATACLPIAGTVAAWYGNRVVASADRVAADVADMKTNLQLLQQTVKFAQETGATDRANLRNILTDHEGRIRVLEAELPLTSRRQ